MLEQRKASKNYPNICIFSVYSHKVQGLSYVGSQANCLHVHHKTSPTGCKYVAANGSAETAQLNNFNFWGRNITPLLFNVNFGDEA